MIPLIDTHQHLIYRQSLSYPWAERVPALAGQAFTLPDYQALTADAGIAGTLVMEADVGGDWRAEARWVASLAGQHGSGILGQIATCRPETDEGFGDWLDEGAALGVVGYRRILHEAPDDVSQSDTFRANVRRIGAAGKPFDMVLREAQLGLGVELARACPDTTLVLDHCGVPDIAGGATEGWAAAIDALAACPNVVAKVSGILAYADAGATRLSLGPWIDHVLASFGPARCLWGSDWPVVNVRADLPVWLAITREVLAGLSEDEARAVASGTAERVYGVKAREV